MKPLCVAPWTTLIINGSVYNCCCFYGMPNTGLEFPRSEEEVMKIFNSKGFRDLRQRLIDGNIKGTGCEVCLMRRGQALSSISDEFKKDVVDKARKSIAACEVEVDYPPFLLALNTSPECNLRCIMCYNSDLPKQRIKGSLVPYKRFISMLSDVGLDNVEVISVVGGEPFMTEDALETFRFIADTQKNGVRVSVNTNGTLLHNHWDLIEKLEGLRLEFSIDAFEDNYEKIRKGASWKRMLNNFETYSSMVKDNPGLEIGINVVVMKSSLPDLAKVLRLGAEHNARVRFSSIIGDYFDENIFQFPELLAGMPWQSYFDEAITIGDESDPDAAEMLRGIRKDIQERIESAASMKMDGGCPDVFVQQEAYLNSLPQKRIALLGTSAGLMSLLGYLEGRTDKEFVISDFEIGKTDRKYLGYRVVSPEEVPDMAEVGVVTTKSYKYMEYKNWFAEKYPNFPVSIIPLWPQSAYDKIKTVRQELGDRPVVLFATGGTADILLDSTEMGELNYVACSDNNEEKWGGYFHGLPIVPPAEILGKAKDVVVFSDFYSKSIQNSLEDLHGEAVNVHTIF